MGTKKKKRNKKKKITPVFADMSEIQLEQQGQRCLRSGNYKDAIPFFKELLCRGDVAERREFLTEAYLGWVNQLVEKGFVREALAILETMTRSSLSSGQEALHISLLLRIGKYKEAALCYCRFRDALSAENCRQLEALFGALLLGGEDSISSAFPDGSSLLEHHSTARQAMISYCAADDAAAERALKLIPFRSPFRDFRLLLKGMLLRDTDAVAADRFLEKISVNSPYSRFGELYSLRTDSAARILTELKDASAAGRKNIQDLFGIDTKGLQLLSALAQAGENPYKLYNALSNHGVLLGQERQKMLMRRLLPHCGEMIVLLLPRHGNFSMSEIDHLIALAAELDNEGDVAVEFWDDFLASINDTNPENHLKVALVLRYQVGLMERSQHGFPYKIMLEKMEKSFQLDPHDKEAWLKACEIAGHIQETQRYQLVNRAVEKMPDDLDILLLMIEAAARRGAFKKASRFADHLLEIDPINSHAKKLLVEARLAHGRKLAGQGKLDLAQREFEAEAPSVRSAQYRGRHLICLGMLYLLRKQKEEGLELIEEGRQLGPSRLASLLLTAIEARLMSVAESMQRQFDKELRKETAGKHEKDEIFRLVGWIKNFKGDQWRALRDSVPAMKKVFNHVAEMSLEKDEGLLLCQALFRVELFIPLGKLAVSLLKPNAQHVELQFYRIWAKSRGGRQEISPQDRLILTAAVSGALASHDFLLADRIKELLDASFHEGYDAYWDDWDEEDEHMPDELIDDFFDDGPFKLPKQTRQEQKKNTPVESTARQLNLFDLNDEDTV